MRNYYYTVAALETTRLDERAPISEEKFLQFAEDTIDARDYQVLLRSRWGLTEPTGSSFADRILSWEKELRLELANQNLELASIRLRHYGSDVNDSLLDSLQLWLWISPLDADAS